MDYLCDTIGLLRVVPTFEKILASDIEVGLEILGGQYWIILYDYTLKIVNISELLLSIANDIHTNLPYHQSLGLPYVSDKIEDHL